ncbi:MAG: glutathione peroxidase [Bacteroidales bacterium]|nr:glutathione peroxidase [Bacteroidales bacterium]
MKRSLLILISVLFLSAIEMNAQEKTFYDFTVKSIDGKDISLSTFEGKKILVVNTASKCGNTPQYKDLEELFEEYGDNGFTIIGFPANNFGRQEPGTNEEIKEFCEVNYGVTFPMMAKISVKGDDMHPLYQWLTSKSENGVMDSEVTWNFQKYMIDEQGHLVGYVNPRENPKSDKIIDWIKE